MSKYDMFKDEHCHWINDKDAKYLAQSEEKAYRRGVAQTFAMLRQFVESHRIELDIVALRRLESHSYTMRYSKQAYPALLHQLLENLEQLQLESRHKPAQPENTFKILNTTQDPRRIKSYNGILTEHVYPAGTIKFEPPPYYCVLSFEDGTEILSFDPDVSKPRYSPKKIKKRIKAGVKAIKEHFDEL